MGIYSVKKDQFSEAFQRRIHVNEPLRSHCIYRVGGPSDLYFEAKTIDDLENIVRETVELKIPFRVIGNGSNVLFRDAGFRGMIMKNSTKKISVGNDELGAFIEVESGATMAELIRTIEDLEEFRGLPGTIGGAVYGNAGCFGKEIGDFVESVEVLDISNRNIEKKILKKSAGALRFMYRWSSLQDMKAVILRIFLRFVGQKIPKKIPDLERERCSLPVRNDTGEALPSLPVRNDKRAVEADNTTILQLRAEKQPPGYSCGSYFKNPACEKSAGQLIDEAGFKGKRVGGAQVSEKHANFILNTGSATAKDILDLASLIKETVYRKFGVELKEEVRIL